MKRLVTYFFLLFLIGCGVTETNGHEQKIMNEEAIETLHTEVTLISAEELNDIPPVDYSLETQVEPIYSRLESLKKVKEIKNGVFQGVFEEVIENQICINFYTWVKENGSIEIIDHTAFNDVHMKHGLEAGHFYLNLWEDIDSFYLSYHDLQLSENFLEVGHLGQMPSSPITIGMSSHEVEASLGPPTVTDWYYGAIYYFYNDIAFLIGEDNRVVAIEMPGNRIKTELQDVQKELGEPTSIQYSELDDTIIYLYEIGEYTIAFEAYKENSNVITITLYEN
ncbi:DUF4309 domain-containing protein [Anaerobacillus isosaccharinicus]|uniref:DUF4309 domain-containing protein n=1 Tax=Anaerobacillus isosaccharinicus TaxID=1532552 RepID=A0A1S2MEE9_9BACI|nr:DUF4309 domain-containing protein [Anaerobacillus isosaccharinicus]MBA5587846.1 DUF4309 domain-containing protein [Anaerobacillus isosaccharinicus]QOY34000.1 DUF4309 domain-containing protein [Anaerobacillus isosaccharinicus]